MRIQKAIAIYTLAQQNPSAFNEKAVYTKIFSMIGIDDAQNLFNESQPAPPQPDPVQEINAQAQMVAAQAKMMDAQTKAQTAQVESGIKAAGIKTKNLEAMTKQQAAQTDAQLSAMDQQNKLRLEHMKLQQSSIVHGDKARQADRHKAAEISAKERMKANDHMHQLNHQERQNAHENNMNGLDLMAAVREHNANLNEARREQETQIIHDRNQESAHRQNELEMEKMRINRDILDRLMAAPKGESER